MKFILMFMTMAAAVLLGTDAAAQQSEGDEDALVEYEDAKVDLAYILPEVDWQKYKSVYISPLRVTPEARDARPKRLKDDVGAQSSWLLREEDISDLAALYADAMLEEMSKSGGLEVVDAPHADTLIIAASIVDIYLTRPREDARTGSGDQAIVYDEYGGAMVMVAVLGDGATEQVLARALDKRYPAPGLWYTRNTRERNLNNAHDIFKAWAKNFRKGLKAVKSGEK